jgi:hypothetical protein
MGSLSKGSDTIVVCQIQWGNRRRNFRAHKNNRCEPSIADIIDKRTKQSGAAGRASALAERPVYGGETVIPLKPVFPVYVL